MKHFNFICIITVALLFSSCASTYYFSTLDTTTDNTLKGDNGDFITTNDSVLVAYCFSGEEGPMLIIINNKGDKPLYVDWQRSSIIFNERATSYYDNNIEIIGTTDGYPVGDSFSSYSSGGFRGRVNIPEGVSFIPPHSRIEYQTVQLGDPSFENIPDNAYIKTSFAKKDNSQASIKILNFDKENTPFKFRSYLTLYTNPNQPFTFEHEFYVSNLIKSKALKPSNMDETLMNRGDLFYIEKESGGKGTGTVLLVGGLVVGLAVLDVATSNNDCYY